MNINPYSIIKRKREKKINFIIHINNHGEIKESKRKARKIVGECYLNVMNQQTGENENPELRLGKQLAV